MFHFVILKDHTTGIHLLGIDIQTEDHVAVPNGTGALRGHIPANPGAIPIPLSLSLLLCSVVILDTISGDMLHIVTETIPIAVYR